MTLLIIIVTGAALWAVINLCAWGVSEAESDENRRVAKGRGVVMVFGVIALCLWGLSASALTVQHNPAALYPGLVWVDGAFRPVTGPDVYADGKSPCPKVGPSWKDPRTDQVIRERRCSTPPEPETGWRWAKPIGLAPPPVIYSTPGRYAGTGWFGPGGGGCGCVGGGHTPPHETPPTPTVPIPLPLPAVMLVSALGGLIGLRRRAT